MFLQTPPRPQQWLAMCHLHSMELCVLILHGGSAKALVRTEGNVKLPPDEVSKGAESWREKNNKSSVIFFNSFFPGSFFPTKPAML